MDVDQEVRALQLTGREKILVFLALILVIGYVFDRLLLEPLILKHEGNAARIARLHQIIKQSEMEQNLQKQQKAGEISWRQQDKQLDEVIPPRQGGAKDLHVIQMLTSEYHLQLVNLHEEWESETAGNSNEDGLKSYLINCRVKGHYEDIKAFLAAAEKEPRLLIVEKLVVDRGDGLNNTVRDLNGELQEKADNRYDAGADLTFRLYFDNSDA